MKKLKTLTTVIACLAGLSLSVPAKADSKPDWESRKYYSDIAVGDVCGDNKPDIVYISTNQSYYNGMYPPYYIMIKENLGDGKFKIHKLDLIVPEIESEDGTYPHVVDIDGDGLNDIILKSGHHSLMFKNHGNLRFSRYLSSKIEHITGLSKKKNNLESKVGEDKPAYETKIDTSVENGYTHIKRTWIHVRNTSVVKDLGYQVALGKVLDEMDDFKYVVDKIEHLQFPDETQRLKEGDCEDFTDYFLWGMKQYGVPIEKLGICLLQYPLDQGAENHIMPIVKNNEGEWMVMETFQPGSPLIRLKNYTIREHLKPYNYALRVCKLYGLHEEGEVVIEPDLRSEKRVPFKEYQRVNEEELVKEGYAID